MLTLQCAECAAELPGDARFCPSCGLPVSSVSQMPTGLATPSQAEAARRRTPSSSVGRISSGSHDGAGFAPGVVLAERYRIIGLIGRGGMGEVYRADDLKLGQAVALKFLPERLASDRAWIDRFYSEVRLARQVSHPNVCRVYDVGEIDGRHYLSMEYVDGEDLASLLRRIGRIGGDKGLEIARQLCAGLAAAHDRGVLHRDLKPSNVMIDGRGRARVTDFGLAVSGDEQQAAGDVSGTPAYMAPEQLAGEPATVQSDLYALGLVLYELFTGKKAFEAATFAEWKRMHGQDPPAPPSTVAREMDPIIERAILRCLEKDPRERPRSALAVAATLPGGNPLAAALAAGETPSPEMVAAAGQVAAMNPAVAWLCLLLVVAGAAAAAVLSPRTSIHGMTALEKSPEILANRARDMVSRLGYPQRPRDTAFGFRRDYDYVDWIERHDRSPDRWKDMADGRPAGLRFWFRQSPTELVPHIGFLPSGPEYNVDEENPALSQPDMVLLRLDPTGRLIHFQAVPPRVEAASSNPRSPDWAALFGEAGLDPARFSAVPPRRLPETYADARAAWAETPPERADRPFRIEAAAYRGRPVYFELLGPWSQPSAARSSSLTTGRKSADIFATAFFLSVLLCGALIARQNLRRGRGDRRGALRVATLLFVTLFLGWLFGGTHAASVAEVQLLFLATGLTLFLAAVTWILYVALEPLVRRHWPDALISWTRLLSGRITDPRVGRDLLVAAAGGTVLALLPKLEYLLHAWLETTPPAPVLAWAAPLMGVRQVASNLVSLPAQSLLFGIAVTLLIVLLRGLLRREWAAAAVLIALIALPVFLDKGWIGAAFAALAGLAHLLVLIRLGLFAVLALSVISDYLNHMLTVDLSLWYAPTTVFLIFLVVGLGVFAFRSALAGKPAWGALKMEG